MKKYAPGILLSSVISVVAIGLERLLPYLDGIVIGILLGMLVGNVRKVEESFLPGIRFCEKHFLAVGISLLGLQMRPEMMQQIQGTTLMWICLTTLFALFWTTLCGYILGMGGSFSFLTAIGNAICGNAAIAACSGVLTEVKKSNVVLAISVVNLLGSAGVFWMPLVAEWFHLSSSHAAFLMAASLQSVGHVVAAAYSLSPEIGTVATALKLVRVCLLAPLLLILAGWIQGRSAKNPLKFLPWYLYGFIGGLLLAQVGFLPSEVIGGSQWLSKTLSLVAMTASGLSIQLSVIRSQALRAFAVGIAGVVGQVLFILWGISLQG